MSDLSPENLRGTTRAATAPPAGVLTADTPPPDLDLLLAEDLLRCPADGSALTWNEGSGRLEGENGCHSFALDAGIPLLFAPNEWPADKTDVTTIVQQFY